MLRQISIRNFVIVDQIDLGVLPGFTVLTGETGAGKSMMIDALTLVLGERGDANLIRLGCERAEISADFDISRLAPLVQWLNDNDLQGEPDSCLLRRIIESNGRSRNYINGHAVTLQQMRMVGEYLIAIHSQHAHQQLLQKDAQRELLDAFAGCGELAKAVESAYQHWKNCQQLRINMEERAAELLDKRDQLESQLTELSALNFSLTEWQQLQTDHSRLSHLAALMETAEMAINALSDCESPVLGQLNAVVTQLQNMQEYDQQLQPIADLLESGHIQVRESLYELKHYRQNLELDPQALQQIEQRMSAIYAAARKFRVNPEQLPVLMESLSQQLEALGADADIDRLRAHETAAWSAYRQHAGELTAIRQQAGGALSRRVTGMMQTLAMEGGQFSVALVALEQGSANGLEHIEFQVAAHQGLPLRPLTKVASGGELSRISLAIQVVTSKIGVVPTLVFDEVDVGIGGKVAEIVGQLLKKLGQERQVLCITHLPQVAAAGDQQWQVVKTAGSGEGTPVVSQISTLDPQQRVEEIARMLGGAHITETTRRHAAEMLQSGAKRS
ncbi:DNA repair protein RecN [Nitrosomonas sp. sh817]|uniref:DNA repair protein RecN n=1 Tax=Nitrosomonas sp. sh817 TaxID=3070658 RepID=UPI0027DC85B4|nr:DNA repair protein RecN [Nitrosomonas sp. sh817]WMJ07503.1 DNA repair protein RecN [Nitrosomonas sp. sh817]